jgi:hypothetical protein
MAHHRTSTMAAVLLAVALGAACGREGENIEATTTTAAAPSTETTATAPLEDEPPLRDDGPSGSGCTPGAGELPDGWWYGTVTPPIASELSFDLACYFVGAAAEAEAARRGDEVNNDYYVVNDNPQSRTLPLASGATASCVELGSGVQQVDCAPGDVDGEWAVWLRVQAGEVDRIVEQYAP